MSPHPPSQNNGDWQRDENAIETDAQVESGGGSSTSAQAQRLLRAVNEPVMQFLRGLWQLVAAHLRARWRRRMGLLENPIYRSSIGSSIGGVPC